jgi:hypothetical protein
MSKLLTITTALIALVVVGVVGYFLLRPPVALLSDAGFDNAQISPNADGVNDITTIRYTLARNARVSISLENQDTNELFYFRENEPRTPDTYSVLFSGIVDGYTEEGESIPGTIERRLIPNGSYTWTIEAVNDDETARKTGTFEIVDGDIALPVMSAFEINPQTFTPNQDGIHDRIDVNIYLEKEADLQVYLQDASGQRYYLPERIEGRQPGEAGNHEYDYDGGVDQDMEPPADGLYAVYAVAQDAEGQRIVRQSEVTIQDGGLPRTEIRTQTTGAFVYFEAIPYNDTYYTDRDTQGTMLPLPEGVASELSTITMLQGDLLIFKLTVYNYGATPIRTAGPFPGTVYNFDQTAASLEAYEQSGAWRVGIDCHTAYSDFPWRWALGPQDELEAVYDEETDETYYYLLPGQQAEVWGGIRMTEIRKARNPQECWAGLIHEDVGIPDLQRRVGAREIELVPNPEFAPSE